MSTSPIAVDYYEAVLTLSILDVFSMVIDDSDPPDFSVTFHYQPSGAPSSITVEGQGLTYTALYGDSLHFTLISTSSPDDPIPTEVIVPHRDIHSITWEDLTDET